MSTKTNAGKITAGFGAAAAALHAVPELNADVVDITFNPGSVAWTSTSTVNNVSMATTGGKIGSFSAWNDSVGKTFIFLSSGLASWRAASSGEVINASTFAGDTGSWSNSTTATGTVYMAFKTLAGNVGWFSTTLNGVQGAMIFGVGTTGGAQYGNDGESVTVASSTPGPPAVPGLGGLAALAVGAAGLRGRRQRAAAS
ncbi:hypothetical protein N9411_00070 [bacterium]|nr:hypothetical protein [bacterium]